MYQFDISYTLCSIDASISLVYFDTISIWYWLNVTLSTSEWDLLSK